MLNKIQKEIVEQNHNLIYWYAKSRGLSLDEFYDILAIGLCKAAQSFDDTKNNEFSTYAKECMKNEVANYYRSINRQINNYTAQIIYIDGLKFDDEEIDYDKILVDNSTKEDMLSALEQNNFIELLNNREKLIVELLLMGYNRTQIADVLHVSRQYIAKLIKSSIRKKWNFCNNVN